MTKPANRSNFAHFDEIDPPLAMLGAHVERYFVDNANTTHIKTRQFAKCLTQAVAERTGIEAEDREKFADLLRRVRGDKAVPPEILDILHRLRVSGNEAAHSYHGERRLAFDVIKLCHRLGVWLRATITRTPGLAITFIPPQPANDEADDLRSQLLSLETDLAAQSTQVEHQTRELQTAHQVAVDTEERARLAEEERQVYEKLALDAEQQQLGRTQNASSAFVKAAFDSAKDRDFDEDDTRMLVDEQLRQAGWAVDTKLLRHSVGTRPERNRAMAIAEWPTLSSPADYALGPDAAPA